MRALQAARSHQDHQVVDREHERQRRSHAQEVLPEGTQVSPLKDEIALAVGNLTSVALVNVSPWDPTDPADEVADVVVAIVYRRLREALS